MVVRQTVSDAAATSDRAQAGEQPAGDFASFGDEFRELARQRRFVREAERAAGSLSGSLAARVMTAPPRPAAPTSPPPAAGSPPAGPRTPAASSSPTSDQRITGDAAAMLAEMSRLADRVVESREALGAARARAERAEGELANVNDRMMAARALVHEAQRTARAASERTAWLEGRNETLQDALEIAVNASPLKRWMWRRRMGVQTAPIAD